MGSNTTLGLTEFQCMEKNMHKKGSNNYPFNAYYVSLVLKDKDENGFPQPFTVKPLGKFMFDLNPHSSFSSVCLNSPQLDDCKRP